MSWLTIPGTRSDPSYTEYIGPRSLSGEWELDPSGKEIESLAIDGTPIPSCVLREMALNGIRLLTEQVYSGARLEKERDRIDAAAISHGFSALCVQATFDVAEDGTCDGFRDVKLCARKMGPGEVWESVSVERASAGLWELMKERAEAQIASEK